MGFAGRKRIAMTDEERTVRIVYPDAKYFGESKWWRRGVWIEGVVNVWLGEDWADAAHRLCREEGEEE